MSRKKWGKEELICLEKLYPTESMEEMIRLFDRNMSSIISKASLLGIKRAIRDRTKMRLNADKSRRSNLEILMNSSHESLYWIGFILADGHISDFRLNICLALKDKLHLENFGKYIKCDNISVYNNSIRITAQNKNIIPQLKEKYQIKNNKTFFPPNISQFKLTNNQFLALIIGYIDGDGNISKVWKRNDCFLRIRVHSTWLENLKFIEQKIYDICEVNKPIRSRIGKDGYALLQITDNNKILRPLRKKIDELNIPYMMRKWNLI